MDTNIEAYFDQSWFDSCPVPMSATDDMGRIRWINQTLSELTGLPASQLLGCSRETLPVQELAVLFESGQPIQLPNSDRWLQCDSTSINGPEQAAWSLNCYREITEQVALTDDNQRLRDEVNALQITDSLTGFPNHRGLLHGLELHVSRSRRYQNPLSLVHFKAVIQNATSETAAQATLVATSRFLRERLRWVDQIGRWDEDTFAVILPETELEAAQKVAQEIIDAADDIRIPAEAPGCEVDLFFGAADWQKGDDARTLVRKVTSDLEATEAA